MSTSNDMTPEEMEAALAETFAEPATAREEAEAVAAAYGWVGLPQAMQARDDVQGILEAVEQMRALDASMRPEAEARLDASKWQHRAAYRVRWALVKQAGLISLGTLARKVLPWVLDTINRHGFIGWRDQKDFAAALNVRPSHMSEAMTELASADLIRRTGTHRTGLAWSDEQDKIVPTGRGWSYTFGWGGYGSFEALLGATAELPCATNEVPKSGTSPSHREVPRSGTSKSAKFPDRELQKVEVPDFRKTRGTSDLRTNELREPSELKRAAAASSGQSSGVEEGRAGGDAASEQEIARRALVHVPSPERAREASPTTTPPPTPAPSASSRAIAVATKVEVARAGLLDLAGDDGESLARIDAARRRVLVVYPSGRPLAISWEMIEAAAAAAGWSSVAPERLLIEVQSIAEGWASRDKPFRSMNVVTDLTTDLTRARGKLAKAMAAGKVAEAEARAAMVALLGPDGRPRRFVDGLTKQIVCNVTAMTFGGANAILDAADGLRKGDPIASTGDVEAVLRSVEKGEKVTDDDLARRVAVRAARRHAGLPLAAVGGWVSWLKDRTAIIEAVRADWPHVDVDLIETIVGWVDGDPRVAGFSIFDWTDTTEAVVVATIRRTFGTFVMPYVRRKIAFAEMQEWLDGKHSGGMLGNLVHSALRGRHDQHEITQALRLRLRDRLPRWRSLYGTADAAAIFEAEFRSDFREVLGADAGEFNAAMVLSVSLHHKFRLVQIDAEGRATAAVPMAA